MKTNLPKHPRLTEEEDKVIKWAFNFAHSIVAGDYHLPQPMNYTMNNLQDAVWNLAQSRGMSIVDGCTKEYLGFQEGYQKGIDERLRELGKEVR